MKDKQGGLGLKYVVRQRKGEGGWRKVLGTLLELLNAPLIALVHAWQKHAPLHHDVAQSDVCGHPTQYRIKSSSSPPFSTHPSYNRNPLGHTRPDMLAKFTLSISG